MAGPLPLYRHPTLTLLVDDAKASMRALGDRLSIGIGWVACEGAAEAAAWAGDQYKSLAPAQAWPWFSGGPGRPATADAGAEAIYRYVADPQRFYAPAVVVADFDASAPGALVAFEAVAHLPCKKIWYAEQAEDGEGIEAFNRGLIDRFIRAESPQSIDRLEEEIAALQAEYFMDRSRDLPGYLLDPDAYHFLRDPAVAELVDDMADRYGFVEHYLFNSPSGLLFFDAEANPTLMVVMTEQSMARQFDRASAGGAPPALLKDLFECRVVPFFQTPDGLYPQAPVADPGAYCREARLCMGESAYYWALFELPLAFRRGVPYSHTRFLSAGLAAGM